MNELIRDLTQDPVFAVCALVATMGAFTVVLRRNPMYSALGLMMSFLSIAVLFVRLQAPFLAAMHVLVYTGAILVLFLFVIMLLNLKPVEQGGELSGPVKALFGILATGLFVMLGSAMVWTEGLAKPPADVHPVTIPVGAKDPHPWGGVEHVGYEIFSKWALPFELVSLLIVVAILGAVVLAKRRLPPEV